MASFRVCEHQRHGSGLLVVALLTATLGTVLSACTADTSTSVAPTTSGSSTVGTELHSMVPESASDAPLVDSAGNPTSLGMLRGKVVVLTDFLTLCREICPLTSVNYAAMADATRQAGVDDRVEFVELSVDPERDTPERLRAYEGLVGTAPNWTLLTGSPEAIAAVWQSFGVDYERTPVGADAGSDWWTGQPLTYDVAHTDALIFIDADGIQRHIVVSAPNAGDRPLPPDLDRQLDAEGRENVLHPAADAWTVAQALDILGELLGTSIPER